MVEVEHGAFANIDEETNVLLAPEEILVKAIEGGGFIRLTSAYVVVHHQSAGICRSGWEDLASSSRYFVRR